MSSYGTRGAALGRGAVAVGADEARDAREASIACSRIACARVNVDLEARRAELSVGSRIVTATPPIMTTTLAATANSRQFRRRATGRGSFSDDETVASGNGSAA